MVRCAVLASDGSPCSTEHEHVHCPQCGAASIPALPICAQHIVCDQPEWAVVNRLYCDGFHRNAWPVYVPEPEPAGLVSMDWA
jgi:hypothetical protein